MSMFVNRLSECFVSVLEIEHAIVNRDMPDGLFTVMVRELTVLFLTGTVSRL